MGVLFRTRTLPEEGRAGGSRMSMWEGEVEARPHDRTTAPRLWVYPWTDGL